MWVLTCSKTRELSNMYNNIPDSFSQHLESVSVGEKRAKNYNPYLYYV